MNLDIWLALGGQGLAVGLTVFLVAGALFGAATARWARYPLWVGIPLGVLVPVLGPVVAGAIAANRNGRQPAPARARRPRWNALWLLVPALAALAALMLPWWLARWGSAPTLPLFPSGRLLDVALIITLVVIVAAGLLVAMLGAIQLGAILLLTPMVVWALTLWFTGAVTAAIQDTIGGVADLSLSVEELLASLGVSVSSLPLSAVGIDADSVDVTDFVAEASLQLGAGWYVMLVATLALAAWVVWASFTPPRQPSPAEPDALEPQRAAENPWM